MDTTTPTISKLTNQVIALIAIIMATTSTFAAFFLSRTDHDLKLMSLTAVISIGSGLMGIAGTLLVGIAAYKTLVSGDMPPGSSIRSSEQSEIKTGPIVDTTVVSQDASKTT